MISQAPASSRLVGVALLALGLALAQHGCSAERVSEDPGGKSDDIGPAADASTPIEPECMVTVSPAIDYDVIDFDRLLELATTSDWPFATLEVVQLDGCIDVEDNLEAATAIADLVVDHTFPDLAEDFPQFVVRGEWRAGDDRFSRRVNQSVQAVHEQIDDGLWDPDADAEGRGLFDRMDDMAEAILDADAPDGRYVEFDVEFENAECSEDAVGRLDTDDGRLTIIHRLPRC